MSADNYSICPRCLKKRDDAEGVLAESYGKISAGEYHRLLTALREKTANLEDTLREDYEQHLLPNGEYFVDYSASCSKCKFSFEFHHKEQVKTNG